MSTTKAAVRDRLAEAVHQSKALSRTGFVERLFSSAFTGMVYPQIWEDPVADMAGLDIQPGDTMICIASGGCNAMSYLTADPGRILAVDLSPAHIALLELKKAAAKSLADHDAYFQVFGHADRAGSAKLLRRLVLPKLAQKDRAYWEGRMGVSGWLTGRRRLDLLDCGFYRHGLLGWFIGCAHKLTRLFGVRIEDVLHAKTPGGQKQFFDTQIAPLIDRKLVRKIINNRASLVGLGIPPQQYEALAGAADGDIQAVLRERLRKLMCDFPFQENYFAWQAFGRRYEGQTGSLPPYLQQSNFTSLGERADRITALNRSFTDVLADQPTGSQNHYILLDAQDWMNDEQLNALWAQITRTAAPGAKVLFRTAGIENILPGRVAQIVLDRWDYRAARSQELSAMDRSAIYGGTHLYVFAG
ncbi:MAG: DUF3419 family protein [Pseudomonadota bacterium]